MLLYMTKDQYEVVIYPTVWSVRTDSVGGLRTAILLLDKLEAIGSPTEVFDTNGYASRRLIDEDATIEIGADEASFLKKALEEVIPSAPIGIARKLLPILEQLG